MLQRLKRGLSFANVMSAIAVFIALSAGAFAALGKNSVGSKQIKTGAVRAPDIRDGAVRAAEIKDGSVLGAEIKDGAVAGAELANGAVVSAKLANGAVSGPKLANEAITASKVQDGSLGGDDVGEASFFNFAANIGVVGAQTCVKRPVTGLPTDARDHLILTTSHNDVNTFHLISSAEWSDRPGEMFLVVCNVSANPVDDEITHFNLLVIDAQ